VFRITAFLIAVLVQAGIASAQNPPPAQPGVNAPGGTVDVNQPPVVQPPQTPQPSPQPPVQPTTPAPPTTGPAPAQPPVIQPPVVGGTLSGAPATGPAGTPNATGAAANAPPVIGAVTPPAPLLPPGTVTPDRAKTAATFLERAAELIDKSLAADGSGKDLKESGKVTVDRATLDEIRASIGQVLSILK
jgi:hypothetical protein